MMEIVPTHLELTSTILAQRAATRERYREIMDAPEVVGRENLAFALALRFDLPADRAVSLLSGAPPDLRAVNDVLGWVETVPRQPEMETVQ
ncbi:hypothetical protein [Methylobacterium planeticum]|uniref:hypothetical protein n=1 Tax=Methylobacterium planeticum TaxID=2615211 RepID=UPI0017808748|nr:hypothetical protein [Methylobacterium planeticum]